MKSSVQIRKYTNGKVVVEAARIEQPADLVQLRAKDDWVEGQLKVLTFPNADPAGYIGVNPPLSMFGTHVAVGQWLVKGPAGDLEVIPDAVFSSEWTEKVA